MRPLADTVVAPITGLNRAAVAVVRLSGPDSWKIASQVFSPWPDPTVPRMATYGRFTSGDDGFVLPFQAGASYTGEDSVEMSVHGSLASVRRLSEACCGLGARPADPGEFTYRAFLNGRIDLTQAEGVRDTVDALTEGQLRQANRLREGALRQSVDEAAALVLAVLAAVEAATDFEEETGPLDRDLALERLGSAQNVLAAASRGAVQSRLVREGITVAITGLPNAGKSSLLNKVAGTDRAIVTPVPGTTRDTVEALVEHSGLVLNLVDTAGLRDTDDPVEALGVRRSLDAVASADIVWYVYDVSAGWSQEDEEAVAPIDRPCLRVANKTDLAEAPTGPDWAVSATTGQGTQRLLDATVEQAMGEESEPGLLNKRHVPLVEAASQALVEAVVTLRTGRPHDLAAVHLQSVLRCFGEITGSVADDSLLDKLFSTFCIGK
ncbi:MAG: tRNA uridine-5-carboxymethylaminomethyl(34) synthesis GTPase MnmE [Armatimonadetes bacterium]|nr:tRNA uridine-5-carboxymethylaminomethyl(34) synthesis GTPase MnmE [Armatimonadota bacterium]